MYMVALVPVAVFELALVLVLAGPRLGQWLCPSLGSTSVLVVPTVVMLELDFALRLV